MSWLALDIGGANLKAADGCGWAMSVPFSLTREADGLPAALANLVDAAPSSTRLAVTMTGELSDAFRTKADGVRQILAAVKQVALNTTVRVYLTNGRWASLDEACEIPGLAAASNWHALARFARRFVDGRLGLLLDIGSTTTDIIPLANGQPAARGATDTERLLTGELVYTGVCHTPICAVTQRLPFDGQPCAIAAEVFATTADAYVLLGDLAERPDAAETPDGRPLTAEFARERLARMVCADRTTFNAKDAQMVAEFVRESQVVQLCDAAQRVAGRWPSPPEYVVISGAGEFLARRVAAAVAPSCCMVSLADKFGAEVSDCAPAHALAVLAREAGVA